MFRQKNAVTSSWLRARKPVAASAPDLKVRYEKKKEKEKENVILVVANCSVDVGSDGFLQWELVVADWLKYCWTVDTKGKVEGNPPPFLINSDNASENIHHSYSNLTGRRIVSTVKFEKPDGWDQPKLNCFVTKSRQALALREENNQPELAAPCKTL
ncbi:hypothetical protein PoB_005573300 [Plakobranchus ocellatus]|uniref:Uncharacterized protein n=1 Tax=Plakobranchus ocellatus TaxID=259542 RepID=A0AAV4CBI9_9GAST|nr:hypothetical protein PoB_005573300 [Plakobranchus ocellatus]